MSFDKTIQKPLLKKEKKSSAFDYGLDIDIENVRNVLTNLQYFRKINFTMHNLDVERMLNRNNIHHFKRITAHYKTTVVNIEKTRNTSRKISIKGDDAYTVFKELKKIK